MKSLLLAGTAVPVLLACAPAFADTAVATATATDAAASTASDTAAVQEVVIYGAGQTRQVQTITQKQIEEAAPGSSPVRVLQSLPGVNYEASDPFGAYEWAVRISVRGFNQNQLGFTLDGVPLGDMSYGNDNGLHISRAISSENLGATQLSEGTGALGTASTSNLGGTIEFHSRAPSDKFGVLAAVSYGDFDDQHEFVRLDTGELAGGGRGYISFGNQLSHKWKGDGAQKQRQINAKFVQPLGASATLTGFFGYSDRAENDYQDLSLGLIKQFGYGLDNISNNWPLAVAIANAYQHNTAYPAPFTNTPDAVDAVYFNGSGLRKDTLGALSLDWKLADSLTLKVTAYSHTNHGEGTWDTPYVPTPGGAPISLRTTEYSIQREGVIGSLDYKIASHDVEGGVWFEHNDFDQARRYYGLDATGANRDNLKFQSSPFYTQWYGKFGTDTLVGHLQDNWRPFEDLKVNFGFKTQSVDITSDQVIGTHYAGKLSKTAGFLPQVGVNYNLHQWGELFADYAQNQRAFVGANTTGPFSTTAAGFAAQGNLKPETSRTVEGGWRYHLGSFQAVLTGYYVKFNDRLVVIPTGPGILGSPNITANEGSVTTKGVELTGAYRFLRNWTLSGSYTYNDSTTDSNLYVPTLGLTFPTSGKTVVDAPKDIAFASLSYDDGSLYGSLSASYMSKRYFSYLNDASVPGHTVADLTLGWRFKGPGLLKGVDLQGNITNLFDERYVASMGTNGYGLSGDNQTLQAGAPRAAVVTLRKQF